MTSERFDHPNNEGPQWTVLVFDGTEQVAGYIGPSEWTNGKLRAYRGSGKTLKTLDTDTEQQCRDFIGI